MHIFCEYYSREKKVLDLILGTKTDVVQSSEEGHVVAEQFIYIHM